VRTQGHGILKQGRANISCAPSYISVHAHVLLLDCVREMIIFTRNVLAVQPNPHPSQHIFMPQLGRYFVSNMYIYYMRHPGANVRWCYSHYKYTFSSSPAIPGTSLFPIMRDENRKSGLTTVLVWLKYMIVEIFRQIGQGLNDVLPEVPKFPSIRTLYSNK